MTEAEEIATPAFRKVDAPTTRINVNQRYQDTIMYPDYLSQDHIPSTYRLSGVTTPCNRSTERFDNPNNQEQSVTDSIGQKD